MFDLIGKTVGPYRILEEVGEGGMATVFKAYQPSMDRYIAVKVLPIHLSKDLEFTKRFQREARAIARLEHSRILPVYDYGEYEGITYIAMRYIKAGTLKDRMSAGRLPLEEINHLISQIGSALDYAHRMGVIHRDIKPGNVLIDDQGDIYLSDFGLARMMEPSQKLTASGVGLGTPAYMSPEQGQGIKVDHRSDIYSLGIILYEMLTGRVPYEAETPMAVVFKHIHGDLPLPHTINPNLPEPIERVVLKALAKNPADRYQTAGEMVQALNFAVRMMSAEAQQLTVVEKVGPVKQDVSSATKIQRLWDRPRGRIMLASGVLISVLLIGFLLFQLPGNITILAPNATNQSTSVAVMTTTQFATTKPESTNYIKKVTVQANQGWQDTGVMIKTGQKITLNYLSGVWRTMSGVSWDNGSNCDGTCIDCLSRSAPEASLVAKVGGGDAVCIGNTTFSSETSGNLYLSFNDCAHSACFQDNEGLLTIEIEVNNYTQTEASEPTPTQPSTPVGEVDLRKIKISSLNSSGTQWCAETAAKYVIEYESGAYSVFGLTTQCGGDGCWSTGLYVYQNREVEWVPDSGDFGPGNPDFEIGWLTGQAKKEDAEILARAEKKRFETNLKSGECLTFLVPDGRTDYSDNIGEVTLRIKTVGQLQTTSIREDSTQPDSWVVAEGGEDLLQLAGWSGCGDFEGGEFTIMSSQENYCGIQNVKSYLSVKGVWGIKVVLEIGPQRNLDNNFAIGNALLGEDYKEIGIGLSPTQLNVYLGTNDGSYFNNSFDVTLNNESNEVEVHSFGDRFELYINGQKIADIPDTRNTFDAGRVYFGAFIGPPNGYFTIHALSALVPVDQPNNVTISTSP